MGRGNRELQNRIAELEEQVDSISDELRRTKQAGHPGHLGNIIGQLRKEKAALISQYENKLDRLRTSHNNELATLRTDYNKKLGHLGHIIGNLRQEIRDYEDD